MKYELIASDFDRTLADDLCPVSEYTKEVIKMYIEAGGKFCIATGRMFKSILEKAKTLGLTGELIAYQGAAVYDIETKTALVKTMISNKDAVRILKIIENMGKVAQAYDEDGDTYYTVKKNPFSDNYSRLCDVVPTYVGMPLSKFIEETGKSVIKIIMMTEPDSMRDYMADMRSKYSDVFSFECSHNTFLEVISNKASKGNAVKALAEKYGISREKVMTFGDATNDISMIVYAGMGVAVGNAMAETKAAADYISESVKEDGVAKTIQKFAF